MAQSNKLTVLQVLPALQSGGVERGTLEVAQALVEHGHRALVMSGGGRLVEALVASGAEHFEWPIGRKSLKTLLLVGRLRRFLIEHQVDIVHARSRVPAWIAYLAWRGMDPMTRPRFVTTVHGPYSVSAYSAVMTRGERVIVISEMIRDYVLANYPATDPARLRLIYRGVDPAAFPYRHRPSQAWLDSWYAQHPETRGKRLLTLPARITRWKGQEDFIDLLALIKDSAPDIHGLIVGETKDRKDHFLAELRSKAEALGVADRISFAGHRSDLREIMAISRIVFSLSREPEAFGRTTVEALSLGVPVIGYNHGGVREQLQAILPAGGVPAGHIREAAETALRWLEHPPEVPAEHPFTLERMLGKTLEVYDELHSIHHT
ncbi:MAG: glycosyltransferase family 4 protein [Pseudomonadota bacterium]